VTDLAVDDTTVLEGAGYETGATRASPSKWKPAPVNLRLPTYDLRAAQAVLFRKFIIVVPSIAIYEGVIKSFQVMKRHFSSLFGNEVVNLIRYDGSKLSTLRSFASSSFVEIMVMTMQSFNTAKGKNSNTLYRSSEQLPGERKPFEYIQETRPILILDEPQNMGSDLSKSALATLHPLFALRYSATHKEIYNLVFRLTPFDAYQRGLVKRIQVDGVFEQHNLDSGTVILREVKTSPLRAVVQTTALIQGQIRPVEVELKQGDNLFNKLPTRT